jgi:hypothetical protein
VPERAARQHRRGDVNPYDLSDGDMLLLLATSLGNAPDVFAGELALPDPANPGAVVPVPTDALDRLEGTGLVEITEAGARVTDRGGYWLQRWMTRKFKVKGLLVTRVAGVGRL